MLSYKQYLEEMAAAAYHGSPHDFDKFKKDHIGTGEGNQAYGYGLYFADAKEVAEYYRDTLTNKNPKGIVYKDREYNVIGDGKRELIGDMKKDGIPSEIAIGVITMIVEEGSLEKAKEAMEWARSDKGNAGKLYKLLLKLKNLDINKGKLYHVILQPDEDEYLLWDEPLNKQSDKVKELIEDRIIGYGNGEYDEYLDSTLSDIYDMDLVDDPTLTGRDLYEKLSYNNNKQSDKKASEYLHSLGIRGIKYLDGTSRSKGKGNYNYVIFDEDDVVLQSKE